MKKREHLYIQKTRYSLFKVHLKQSQVKDFHWIQHREFNVERNKASRASTRRLIGEKFSLVGGRISRDGNCFSCES